jgi:hypothetical protein
MWWNEGSYLVAKIWSVQRRRTEALSLNHERVWGPRGGGRNPQGCCYREALYHLIGILMGARRGGDEERRHLPPASSNKTRKLGSSDRRAASTQPAVPGGEGDEYDGRKGEEMRRLASASNDNIVLKFCGQGSRADFGPHFVQVENISSLGPSAAQSETEDEGESCAGEKKACCGGEVGEVELLDELLEGGREQSHGGHLV